MRKSADWRDSETAVEAAREILALATETCERVGAAADRGKVSKVLALQIVRSAFLAAYDVAAARSADTSPELSGNDDVDALVKLMDETVDPLVEATEADKTDVLAWVRLQFVQAFDRHIAKGLQ